MSKAKRKEGKIPQLHGCLSIFCPSEENRWCKPPVHKLSWGKREADGAPALEAESPPPQGLSSQPRKDSANLRKGGGGERKNKEKIVLLMGSLYQKATKGSPWTRQIGNRPENMKDGHRTLGLACHRAIHFIFVPKTEKGQVWSVSHLYI